MRQHAKRHYAAETWTGRLRRPLAAALATFLAVVLVGGTPPAFAAAVTVRVVDQSGRPVQDAVVSLRPVTGAAPRPTAGGPYAVDQKDMQFHPFVSIVPVGATVAFPNFDPFRHQVYSFSAARKFELKLFARDQTRTVTFDKAGVVAIGCNIHDSMSAYIYVTDTIWSVRTPVSGAAAFAGVGKGTYRLEVWHPNLRAPGGVSTRDIALAGDVDQTVAVTLRPPPAPKAGDY